MGIFDNLDQAQVFENSKYFQPGRYIVDINACKFNMAGFKGDSFVIEATVVAAISDHPDAPKPGELAAQVWNASGEKRDIARNTWLGFLCNVYGIKHDQYTGEQWKAISAKVIDDNALKGTRLYLEVFMKKTKAGGDFTQHAWRGVPTAEQLAEFGLTG
jgi:hypothetical protein